MITRPYLLLKNYGGYEGWAVEDFDTADEALQNADMSRGDLIVRVLQVRVVEPEANNLREANKR